MKTTQTILVTGATGTLGSRVVRALLDRGHAVRAFVRDDARDLPSGAVAFVGDLATGRGLAEATRGVDAIVHAATRFEADNATDLAAARNLVVAARESGVPNLVSISIIGIDDSAFSYFRGRVEIERIITASGVPFTLLRASQFHDFVLRFLTDRAPEGATSMTIPSGMSFQSIDADEVAAALATLAAGAARGRIADMAGPQPLTLETIAEAWRCAARPGIVVEVAPSSAPSDFEDSFRDGRSLAPERAAGVKTWETFLRERFGAPHASAS